MTATLPGTLPLISSNTILVATVLALIVMFVLFVYLLVRRTLKGFKEGMQQGR